MLMENIKELQIEIAEKISQLQIPEQSYAVFDMDNTLLVDDAGEAVFAAFLDKGMIQLYTWQDYIDLVENDSGKAYKTVIDIMEGIKIKDLELITREVMESSGQYIDLENVQVPLPKLNLIMLEIVKLLIEKGIEVYVVSASNEVTVKIICHEYFGIPINNIYGAEVSVNSKNEIIPGYQKLPFAEEKVNLIKSTISGKQIVAGGDGEWDCHFLSLTEPTGLVFWVGDNQAEYESLKNKYFKNIHSFMIPQVF